MDQFRDCRLCQIVSKPQMNEWDQLVWSNRQYAIVPALGALVEGYVLLVAKNHSRTMAERGLEDLTDLLHLMDTLRSLVVQEFGSVTFFEHAPGNDHESAGSCIDHAHLHVLPLEADLAPLIAIEHRLVRIDGLEALRTATVQGESYLFYENSAGERYMSSPARVPSQYLRQLVAATLGRPDEWDWGVFPKHDCAVATAKRFSRMIERKVTLQ